MSLRVLRRALAQRAALAAISLLTAVGALAISASSAMAVAPQYVSVAGHLKLTTSAAAGGVNTPVSLSFQLATPAETTMVTPDKLYITLPKSFALNTAAAVNATPKFGTASGGGYIGAPAKGAKAIASVYIVSLALESSLKTDHVSGKLYLVSGVAGGYAGTYGLEIAVPFGPLSIDFIGPLVQNKKTGLSTVQFTNLDLPTSVSGLGSPQPLPWSTFQVKMPRKTSVGLAGACGGAAGSLTAGLEDFGGSTMTNFTKKVAVVCPPSLAGKFKKAKSGTPILHLTAKARGARFKVITIVLPKAVTLKKALRKDIKVKGAKLKHVKKVHGNLKVTFKKPVRRAHLTISKVLRLKHKVVKRLKHHKKATIKIKLKSSYGASSVKIKVG